MIQFPECPKCEALFLSQASKFFGIISPKGMKILIGLFALGLFVFAMFALFTTV